MAKKLIPNMHYEARVSCVVKFYGKWLNRKLSKKDGRGIHMSKAQYLKVVPQWLAGELPCYKMIVDKWVSDAYKVQHADASARRAILGDGVHRQGPLTLGGGVKRKLVKTGQVITKLDAFFETRKPKKLKPDVPVEEQWITKGSGHQWKAYCDKFKEVNGPEYDPHNSPFDAYIAMLAGEGRKNGRLLMGGASVDTSGVPSLSQIRASRTSSAPAIERRPQPGRAAFAAMEAEVQEIRRIAAEAEKKSQATEEKMVAMQACLAAIMERMGTLPMDLSLPPLPSLPPLGLLFGNPSAGSNTAMEGGTGTAGASPLSTPSSTRRPE